MNPGINDGWVIGVIVLSFFFSFGVGMNILWECGSLFVFCNVSSFFVVMIMSFLLECYVWVYELVVARDRKSVV